MHRYDFKSLSPYDFECLVQDLLQQELGLTLESFASGRDSGIDLRYSKDPKSTLVIQCKHFVDSGCSQLISHLKNKEAPKVHKLNPQRYILATSVRLTPKNKSEILAILKNHIHGAHDIFGSDDLNNLLRKFPHTERAHFKLYINSIETLLRVQNNSIYTRSTGLLEAIQKKSKIFVPSAALPRTQEALEKHHVCILAGIPGVGKTTLAQMLSLHYVMQGYDLAFISSDIDEAERIFSQERPQIFYYDDFLGQTSLAEKLGKNEDDRLLTFIQRISDATNKRLILTTREYILTQARMQYEKLDRGLTSTKKYIIEIGEYTRTTRAKILYNHLYFSAIPQDWKQAVLEGNHYLEIIDHKNFNPRTIEGVFLHAHSHANNSSEFISFFRQALDDPKHLWEHPFQRQLSVHARSLLLVLSSLPTEVDLQDLKSALVAALPALSGKNFEQDEFLDALKVLEGTFIHIMRVGGVHVVGFHNPSIRDFVLGQLNARMEYTTAIASSLVFFSQGRLLWEYAKERWEYKNGKQIASLSPYPGMLLALKKNSALILAKQKSAYDSEDCAIERSFQNHQDEISTKIIKANQSRERKLSFIIDFSREMERPLGEEWLESALTPVVHDWRDGIGTAPDVLELLDNLSSSPDCPAENMRAAVSDAVRFFVHLLSESDEDELDHLSTFLFDFRDYFSPPDWSSLRNEFKYWLRQEEHDLTHNVSDPDRIEDRLDRARHLASDFDVDIESEFERKMEHTIEELRQHGGGRRVVSENQLQLSFDGERKADAISSIFELLKGDS